MRAVNKFGRSSVRFSARCFTTQPIDVRPLTGFAGAEIFGVDLTKDVSPEFQVQINQAFLDWGVIFFRDQKLTPETHLKLARIFGEPDVHPIVVSKPGYPNIIEVVKEAGAPTTFGETWHSDNSFFAEPSMASVLYAKQVPPYGNDTLWANMYQIYESLSAGLKRTLDGMLAVHTAGRAYSVGDGREAKYSGNASIKYARNKILDEEVEHPVVRTHPRTKRKSLYVNSMFTVRFKDWTEAESRPLLLYLYEYIASHPEYQCRFRWRNDSIAIWDNRCMQHMAINDNFSHRRVMNRITVKGDKPL